MAAGDFFHNMWLKVQQYAFPHIPHLMTVSALQRIVTKIEIFTSQEDFDREFDQFLWLHEYCNTHKKEILEILPALKEPMEEFMKPNPFDCSKHDFHLLEMSNNDKFIIALSDALSF